MTDYPTSTRLCSLYRKKSMAGTTYFTGKLDCKRISVVKSSKVTDDGEEVWSMLQDEIPAERKPDPRAQAAGAGDFQRQMDDEIPF